MRSRGWIAAESERIALCGRRRMGTEDRGQKNGGRFVVLSLIGTVLFFLPVCRGTIPVVRLIGAVDTLLGSRAEWVAVISCLLLTGALAGAELFKVPVLQSYVEGEGIRRLFWLVSSGIVLLKVTGCQWPVMTDPQIGGRILRLGATVFVTIAVAGSLVSFITDSGIVDAVSVLMEPIMQPVFHLPGEAAVNILSSFVSSASVGVYFTERYYVEGRYTCRQACAVVTSFSVVSVGYIGIIASLCGIGEMYGTLLAASFVLVLLMAAVMVRILPLSRIPDCYLDGSEGQGYGAVRQGAVHTSRLAQAWNAGAACSAGFTAEMFFKKAFRAVLFAQKIVSVMIPTVMLVLVLVYHTPLFSWLGKPLVPILTLFGVPDAAAAAPSVLIGIVEVSLPSILIGSSAAPVQTRFFVALLSIVQIIFFSEAGNAIMGSRIPLGPFRLIWIFLVRTAVAIPLVALAMHILS